MTKESWYTTNQMKLFAIKVPPSMVQKITAGADAKSTSRRAFYRSILVDFLPVADKVSYLASYKNTDAKTLRFWMDRDIYDCIEDLSRKHNVSLTSVCYTALYNHFEKAR